MAPDKKASTFHIYTEKNIIVLAGTSENYLGKQNLSGLSILPWSGVEPGYNFKFQLPNMEKRPSKVARIEVVVSDITTDLQRLESLENAALETFSIKKPLIYMKTVTRAVVKGLATQTATQQVTDNMENGMAFFTRLAATALVNKTENADLRMSRFFPAEAAIEEIHLDEGVYDITINYYSMNNALLHSDAKTGISLKAGKLNVVESSYLN